jgi:hypothetical protein
VSSLRRKFGVSDRRALSLLAAERTREPVSPPSPRPGGPPRCGTRYRALEAVRQYGEELLEGTGELVVTRTRHLQ